MRFGHVSQTTYFFQVAGFLHAAHLLSSFVAFSCGAPETQLNLTQAELLRQSGVAIVLLRPSRFHAAVGWDELRRQ